VKNNRITLSAGVAVLIVLFLYSWFITISPWHARGATSDYYSRQAESFREGQLELQEKPDPALLALPNPYDHRARKDVPVLGDASLYNGKYYLYFGPFPSLVLAIVSAILPVNPGDHIFVYLFIGGLFCIQTLLFMGVVRRFFPDVPGWFIPLGILVLGLTGPFTRMLAHPFIHEAAIAGGQFLFTTGFYFAFLAVTGRPPQVGKLWLAGIFWVFSIATRTTQLIPVVFMFLMTWLYFFQEYRRSKQVRELNSSTLALTVPLVLCGMILAWYNWARFDSVLEFGLYYQLAAFNLQANYDILFSRVYLVQNIYNYFFNPFEVTGSFPFAHPLPGTEQPVLSSFELPNLYAVEGRFAGALVSTPVLLFSIVPVIYLATQFFRKIKPGAYKDGLFGLFDWTLLGMLGSSIAGSIPTLLLFYVGFRYETEFIASLTLLALIGFCHYYSFLKNTTSRISFALLLTSLVIFSLWANISLAFTSLRG
jgi:hypothetical protein